MHACSSRGCADCINCLAIVSLSVDRRLLCVFVPPGNAIAYKTTVSMSNLPGPQFPLSFLECPVERMFFFVSPQGTVGLFVTIFTFDGKVAVSITSDSALLDADAARAITGKCFFEELEALRELYLSAQKTD